MSGKLRRNVMDPIQIIYAAFAAIAIFFGVAAYLDERLIKINHRLKKLKQSAMDYYNQFKKLKPEYSPIAEEILGMRGATISRSKSLGPPTGIFNSQIVCDKEMEALPIVIWTGDIDIKRSREKLIELSNRVGKLYILRESDTTRRDALVIVERDKLFIADNFVEYIRLKRDRQIKEKLGSGYDEFLKEKGFRSGAEVDTIRRVTRKKEKRDKSLVKRSIG
jgi:hypothetical protein